MKRMKKLLILSPAVLMLPAFLVSCSKNNNDELVPNPNPKPDNDELNESGGITKNNLKVDRYINIVNALDLKQNQKLSLLNNHEINQKLHSHEKYKNLNLKILNASNEKEGKLILNLSGMYNEKNIESTITISNFVHSVGRTYIAKNYHLNLNNWFEKKLPILERQNLTLPSSIQEKLNLFSSFDLEIEINEKTKIFNLENIKEFFQLSNINLEIINNELNINVDLTTKYKKYENNEWILINLEEQENIRKETTQKIFLPLPTLKELKTYMINQLSLYSEKLSNFYASYFYGKYLYDVKDDRRNSEIMNFILGKNEIIEKFKQTYFPTSNLYFELDNKDNGGIFEANEINHSLKFNVILIDDQHLDDKSITRVFEFNGFKNIESNFNLNKKYKNDIKLNNNSQIASNIKKIYKTKISDAFKYSKSFETTLNQLPSRYNVLFDFEAFNNNESLINDIKKNFLNLSFTDKSFILDNNLSNVIIENKLNTKNGLISFKNENQSIDENSFFINNISWINQSSILSIKKDLNNNVVVNIKTNINFDICQKIVTQEANINFTISQDEFDTSLSNKEDVKKMRNRLALKLFSNPSNSQGFQIDVSDLNISERDFVETWKVFQNKLFALFPYMDTPTKNIPKLFEKKGDKIIKITLLSNERDGNIVKQNATKLANKLEQIFKYSPNNNHKYNNNYWVYQKVIDWMSYKKTLDSQSLANALLTNEGVCEAYSKLTHILLNSFNINSRLQIGNISGSEELSSGPHMWNQYEINDNWFNMDTTFADTGTAISSIISNALAKPQYLSFPNSFQSNKRIYLDSWYENYKDANYDISSLSNYVPFYVKNNNQSRRVVINDTWYYVLNKTIVKTDIKNENPEKIYDFNDEDSSKFGLWQLGNKFYFVDYKNNESIIYEYDVDTSIKIEIKKIANRVSRFYINNENQLICELNSISEKIDITNDYNFLSNKNIVSLKKLATINSFWFNSIQVGENLGQLSQVNFEKYFNLFYNVFTSEEFNENDWQLMNDFQKNIQNDLNK